MRETEHQEISDFCERVIAKSVSRNDDSSRNIQSKAKAIEQSLNIDEDEKLDYDMMRSQLLDMEDYADTS